MSLGPFLFHVLATAIQEDTKEPKNKKKIMISSGLKL